MLAQLDACLLHRQRIGVHVAWGIDAAIGRKVAGAQECRRIEAGVEARRLLRLDPARGHVHLVLHRHPRPALFDLLRREGEELVAMFAKARVGAEKCLLAAVEVDAPPSQRHCRGRAALGPDDAGGPAAGAIPGPAALEHDDPTGAADSGEVRGPPSDRAGADDDEVRLIAVHIPSRPELSPEAGRLPFSRDLDLESTRAVWVDRS